MTGTANAVEGGDMSAIVTTDVAAPREVRRFGPWQAIWLLVGFQGIQFAIPFIVAFARGFAEALSKVGHHSVTRVQPADPQFLAALTVVTYVIAGLWCYRFVRRRAALRLRDGGRSGIGLCPAPPAAYVAAAILAGVLVGCVILLWRIAPPGQAPHNLFVRALTSQTGPHLLPAIMILAFLLVFAPVVEEFIFRGAMIAGLTDRLGALGAGAVAIALFVAIHIPEKVQYPPGFIDVSLLGVAALWLRLRYRSIRPAMLCHALYNLGVIVSAAVVVR